MHQSQQLSFPQLSFPHCNTPPPLLLADCLPHTPTGHKHKKLASCGDDSNVRVSDLRSPSNFGVSHRLDGVHDGPCHTVRWHPFDSNLLMSAGLDSAIKLHDLRRLDAPMHVLRGHCPYALARQVSTGGLGAHRLLGIQFG